MLHPLPRFLIASPVHPSPRTISLVTEDRDAFDAWVLEAQAPRGLVITCHGYKANRLQLVAIAQGLCQRGYTTVLFDFRGHGSRNGSCTFGVEEIRDIAAVLRWRAQDSVLALRPVGVVGLSLGGAVACQAALRYPEIGALVMDSTYAWLFPILARSIRKQYHLRWPTPWAWITWCGVQLVLGRRLSRLDPVAAAAQLQRPALIIHGMEDQSVPVTHAQALYARWQGPKEQWLESHVGHVGMSLEHPEAYYDRLAEFFDRWLHRSSRC